MELTVVYTDVLIFVNGIIDYLILFTTAKALHIPYRGWRMGLGAFFGALSSLLIFCDLYRGVLSPIIRIMLSLPMTYISFGYISLKELLKRTAAVFFTSILYAGLMIGFYEIAHPPNMAIINDIPYFEVSPLLIIILSAVFYGILSLFHFLFSERIKNTVVSLSFSLSGNTYSCIAKIDTGCNVCEPFSGSPVIIIDKRIADTASMDSVRVVPYSTVDGSSMLYGVKADSVIIDGNKIHKEIYICSAEKPFEGEIQAIINSEIIR